MTPNRRLIATAAAAALLAGSTALAQNSNDNQTSKGELLRPLETQLPGLLDAYVKLRGQPLAAVSDSEPDTDRTDGALAPVVLPQTLATVDQAIATAPSFMLGTLQSARSHYALAQQRLHEGSRDASPHFMVGVLQAMADGQTAMGLALDLAAGTHPGQIALLLPAVQKVREAASRMSQDLIDLALTVGVASSRLTAAQAAMRQGDALHAAGNYGGAVSQYAGALGLAANTVVFDLNRYEQNLRSAFDSQSVGWSYTISQAGQMVRQGAAGQARTGADQPPTAQASTRKMHVASVSKTMTAIVLLRLMADKGLTPDSAIGPFLPKAWARGFAVDSITFRQLMTHRSGFGQNLPAGSDFASLKAMVAQAVLAKGAFDYENANFGLARVIIAVMLGADQPALPFDPAVLTAAAFQIHAMQRYNAVGVPFSCDPAASTPTLQYRFPDTANPGYVEPPRGLQCGGFGVQISAQHLARTMAFLRYTPDLMPNSSFQLMKSNFLGFMDPANNYNFAQGKFGVYHTHGGDWDHTGTGTGGLDSCVMLYPINVEAAVLINSSRAGTGVGGYPNGGYQCGVMKSAFENAWVAN